MIALNLTYNKYRLYKDLDCWSRDMLNFNFSEKSLGLVSSPRFVYGILRKFFLMLHSSNWPNFIVWSPLLLEILNNMSFTIVCYPGFDVTNVEINLSFLIKPFCYVTKKARQKLKYLENKKCFWRKINSIFHHFERAFSHQKFSQTPECAF